MSAPENSKPSLRIPPWLRVKLPCNHTFSDTRALVEGLDLHTVCHSAKCPNMFECFSRKTATFLILGNTCTRNCAFCNIGGGIIHAPDPEEPARVGKAAAALGLRHAVVTSVTRDDLPDGGSAHFAATIRAIRDSGETCPTIEVLIPDFRGSREALRTVMDAEPHIINHNVETPPAHYSRIRPQADYQQSLELLRRVKEAGRVSKSGLMVGLGETDEEVHGVLADLAAAGCDIVTIGQYMRPSQKHHPVERYVHPDIFESYAQKGRELGIPEYLVSRQPFPGPGLAVRIIGAVTPEKVKIVQQADAIYREEVEAAGAHKGLGQYFAALTNMRSVGVMGDERTYDYAVALRAVATADFMTAEAAPLPWEVLARATSRIVNEVPHVNRVLYDCTGKPPATVEFE
mgnify:CR=1 FL=1